MSEAMKQNQLLRDALTRLLPGIDDYWETSDEGKAALSLAQEVLSQPAPLAGEVTDEQMNVHVDNLPTMNQDGYPPLGAWWVQLWDGTGDDAKVIARVYGGDPYDAKKKAESIARAIFALRPQAVPMTDDQAWHSDTLMAANGIAGFKMDALMRIVRAVEAHHGITAKAEGGA